MFFLSEEHYSMAKISQNFHTEKICVSPLENEQKNYRCLCMECKQNTEPLAHKLTETLPLGCPLF